MKIDGQKALIGLCGALGSPFAKRFVGESLRSFDVTNHAEAGVVQTFLKRGGHQNWP